MFATRSVVGVREIAEEIAYVENKNKATNTQGSDIVPSV